MRGREQDSHENLVAGTLASAHPPAIAFGGNNAGPIDVATACNAHGGSGRTDFESETFVTHSLRAGGFDASEDGTGRGTPLVAATLRSGVGNGRGNRARSGDGKDNAIVAVANPITASFHKHGGASAGKDSIPHNHIVSDAAVRRLMPRECERLQGFPDDYTLIRYRGKPAADGPRYKAIGNSMAVPIMRWILSRIERLGT